MGRAIGIDLGTTNSVSAIIAAQPRVLENKENKTQTRSVVGLRKKKGRKGEAGNEEVLVGDTALDNWPLAPKDTIISIKRLMGRGISDPEVRKVQEDGALYDIVEPSDGTRDGIRVIMGGKQYSPIDVSAMILQKVKEDAEFRLGEEVTHAVITVPAYFSQVQRDATRKAGLKAGLKVMKILEEPTAAAIAFGVDSGESTDPKTLVVYDLGGGTFDITVLMWAGNVFAPLNLEGDMWLGGDNFDQRLVNHVVRHITEEYGVDPTPNLRAMAILKKAVQVTKESLSSARSADLIIPSLMQSESGDMIDVEMEITREEFEAMIRPDVDRSVSLVEKSLKNANMTSDQVDYVLMAGNSTAIPLVQQTMQAKFGPDKVLQTVHPKHCVAIGAALLATRLKHVVCDCDHLNDLEATVCEKCGATLELQEEPGAKLPDLVIPGGIAPFAYGTQTAGDKFNLFVEKGEPYPTEEARTQTFYTLAPNQRMISVPVYGGDHLEKASKNERQGDAFAVLPPNCTKDTAIRIKLWLNRDGIFELTAHLEDGTDLRPWVVKGEEDARAIEAIGKIEQVLAEKGASISSEKRGAIDRVREQAYDKIRKGDFGGALQQAEDLDRLAEEIPEPGSVDAKERAQNMIAFMGFVLQQYDWFLSHDQLFNLNALVEEVKSALSSGNKNQLDEKVSELEKALEQLPEAVTVLIGIRGAIESQIKSSDPVLAEELKNELEDVETALRNNKSSAIEQLGAFVGKVVEAINKAGTPVARRCPHCNHELPPVVAERKCPECGNYIDVLGNSQSVFQSSGISTSERFSRTR